MRPTLEAPTFAKGNAEEEKAKIGPITKKQLRMIFFPQLRGVTKYASRDGDHSQKGQLTLFDSSTNDTGTAQMPSLVDGPTARAFFNYLHHIRY